MGTVYRTATIDKAAEGIVFVASTDAVDRMDDVVDQSWVLDQYKANPVILWAHRSDLLPVGKGSVVVHENRLIVKIDAFDEGHELGANVARQVREGFLSAVSVGFAPGRSVARSQLPASDPRYKANGYGRVYYENKLLEISVVPVPANAEALAVRGLPAPVERADDIGDMMERVAASIVAQLVEILPPIIEQAVAAAMPEPADPLPPVDELEALFDEPSKPDDEGKSFDDLWTA